MPELTDREILRYNRQIILRGFGLEGQEKLQTARVLIVGLGGLGCATAQYLTTAGTGHLMLLDFDNVSLSNLQRQILHRDNRIGMAKVESARLTLSEINPYVNITPINSHLNDKQMAVVIAKNQLVFDCTDNVTSREQINRICFEQKKPLVSAATIRMEGQLSVFTWQTGEPCYHCLSRLCSAQTPTCVESGVMAPLVGTMGTLQALEGIKLLCDYGKVITSRLLLFDAMTLQFREMTLRADPDCEICGKNDSITAINSPC